MNHSNTKNIGLVVVNFDTGGLENVVFSLYTNLKEIGFNVTLFSENGLDGYYASLVSPDDFVFLDNNLGHLFAEIASRKINLLNFHHSTFGIQECSSIGLPCVYTIHNCYSWLDKEGFVNWSSQVEHATCIVSVSKFVKWYYDIRSNSKHENSIVIMNGVDINRLSIEYYSRENLYEWCDDRFVFAQFASFYPIKHQFLLIRAAEKLKDLGFNFYMLFFGNVGDKKYFDFIMEAINSSPARDKIRYMGNIANSEVPYVISKHVDCAIATTMQEGNSISILEALVLGVPLIMSNTGAYADLQKLTFDVDYIPLAVDPLDLTTEVINDTSRRSDTLNFDALVDAMSKRLSSGKRKGNKSIQIKRDFPFTTIATANEYAKVFFELSC
jgi:glycosyltransferase involved in cell wall biosynthesis